MIDWVGLLEKIFPYAAIAAPVVVFVVVDLYANMFRRIPPSQPLEKPGAAFPEGFLWGTGEDAYQHEGQSTNNDWHRWVHSEPSPIARGARHGRGTNFWELWREDFQAAADDHHNAHRFGVEWSRLEPQEGVYDEAMWARYAEMVRVAKEEHGFTVFLNLWHFSLPLWAADQGGWENPKLMERWEAYVGKCAERFGPWVDHWSTMIDSQLYALGGYYAGEIPPCKKEPKTALRIYETMMIAHARAYHVLHARLPNASVGQIYFFLDFHHRGIVVDPILEKKIRQQFNWAYLDALITGDVDIDMPLGGRIRRHDETLKGTLDWIGVNYFTRNVVSFNPFHPGFLSRARQTPYPASDMEWEIYPEGIYKTLKACADRYPGVPLFVTECGLADAKDAQRPKFIVDHVAWAHQALEDGVPLKGFFYWSMTDNWEWALGDWPRFGLYQVDYATCARTRTKSAALFARIAAENRLPAVDEDWTVDEERAPPARVRRKVPAS